MRSWFHDTVVSGGGDNLHFWNLDGGELVQTIPVGLDDYIYCTHYVHSKKVLLVGGKRGIVSQVNLSLKRPDFQYSGHRRAVRNLCGVGSDDLFVSCSYDSTMKIFRLFSRDYVTEIKAKGMLTDVLGLDDPPTIVCGSNDCSVSVFDVENVERSVLKRNIRSHSSSVVCLEKNVFLSQLYSGGEDRLLNIYDTNSANMKVTSKLMFSHGIYSLLCMDNSNDLIVGQTHGQISIFDLRNLKKPRKEWQGHLRGSYIFRLVEIPVALPGPDTFQHFHSDENNVGDEYFASSGSDSRIKIWSLRTGRCHRDISGKTNIVALSVCAERSLAGVSSGSDISDGEDEFRSIRKRRLSSGSPLSGRKKRKRSTKKKKRRRRKTFEDDLLERIDYLQQHIKPDLKIDFVTGNESKSEETQTRTKDGGRSIFRLVEMGICEESESKKNDENDASFLFFFWKSLLLVSPVVRSYLLWLEMKAKVSTKEEIAKRMFFLRLQVPVFEGGGKIERDKLLRIIMKVQFFFGEENHDNVFEEEKGEGEEEEEKEEEVDLLRNNSCVVKKEKFSSVVELVEYFFVFHILEMKKECEYVISCMDHLGNPSLLALYQLIFRNFVVVVDKVDEEEETEKKKEKERKSHKEIGNVLYLRVCKLIKGRESQIWRNASLYRDYLTEKDMIRINSTLNIEKKNSGKSEKKITMMGRRDEEMEIDDSPLLSIVSQTVSGDDEWFEEEDVEEGERKRDLKIDTGTTKKRKPSSLFKKRKKRMDPPVLKIQQQKKDELTPFTFAHLCIIRNSGDKSVKSSTNKFMFSNLMLKTKEDNCVFEVHAELLLLRQNFFYLMAKFGGKESLEMKRNGTIIVEYLDRFELDHLLRYIYSNSVLPPSSSSSSSSAVNNKEEEEEGEGEEEKSDEEKKTEVEKVKKKEVDQEKRTISILFKLLLHSEIYQEVKMMNHLLFEIKKLFKDKTVYEKMFWITEIGYKIENERIQEKLLSCLKMSSSDMMKKSGNSTSHLFRDQNEQKRTRATQSLLKTSPTSSLTSTSPLLDYQDYHDISSKELKLLVLISMKFKKMLREKRQSEERIRNIESQLEHVKTENRELKNQVQMINSKLDQILKKESK